MGSICMYGPDVSHARTREPIVNGSSHCTGLEISSPNSFAFSQLTLLRDSWAWYSHFRMATFPDCETVFSHAGAREPIVNGFSHCSCFVVLVSCIQQQRKPHTRGL